MPNHRSCILQYETDVKAGSFLVMAQGEPAEIARAEEIPREIHPSRLDIHQGVEAPAPRRVVAIG
jgi:hypothetical protein